MTKRIRAITLSCVSVLCCLALVVGGTYALFSDSVEVTNHLQAGQLKVRLYRDEIRGLRLTEQGLLQPFEESQRTEFTKETSNNIFGLTQNTLIVPGCEFEAKLTLANAGNVAVGYYLEFVLQGDAGKLSEQLKLTLNVGSETKTVMLSALGDKYEWGSADSPLGRVIADGNAQFGVGLEFVDNDAVNNDAQNQQLTVDVIVHAIQITA